MKKIILALLITKMSYATCVHETTISGVNLLSSFNTMDIENSYYQNHEGNFRPLKDIKVIRPDINYTIQRNQPKIEKDYNDRYVEYYRYERIQNYIAEKRESLESLGYKIETIGKSLEGRDLYAIYPKEIDSSKETILMFGRHHGDEGTANWIIEGFLDNYLSDFEVNSKYQLILYPMVNPDGAENKAFYRCVVKPMP